MCVIVVKPKNTKLPSMELLRNCFENNPHGAGLMFLKNGLVNVNKGYMTFNKFEKRLKRLSTEIDLYKNPLIMHFRIGTCLSNSKENTHPFIVSNSDKRLKSISDTGNLGICHNGIIANYGNEKLTDTQEFIKDFITPIYNLSSDFYKRQDIKTLIKNTTNSKFAFLDKDNNVYTIGDFYKKDGCYFSNYSYYHYDSYYSYKSSYDFRVPYYE